MTSIKRSKRIEEVGFQGAKSKSVMDGGSKSIRTSTTCLPLREPGSQTCSWQTTGVIIASNGLQT